MLRIDNSLLEEVGLAGLPDPEKNSFLKHIYETLEMRVGIRLADQMTNEQLDEFEKYFEAKDDAGAFKWLETNFPNYKEIVQQEFDKLKAEVTQTAPQILAASQAQAQAQQAPQPVQPTAAPAPAVPDATPSPQPTVSPQPEPATPFPSTPSEPQQPFSNPPQNQPPAGPTPYAPQPQQPFQNPQPPSQSQPPYPSQQPPAGPQG